MKKKLVIFGLGEQAEVAYSLFTQDSDYEVVGFTVDEDYLNKSSLFDLPIIPFENIEDVFSSNDCDCFVAIGYSKLNQLRRNTFDRVKAKGYKLPSYVSSKALVPMGFSCGQNCLILELNNIQPYVNIGDNVTLWSGNHVGHHSVIEDDCFITSHVVISGGVTVGAGSFVGVNATFRDHINIGKQCVVGAGSYINNDLLDFSVILPPKSKVIKQTSLDIMDAL
jgi:sugar O-acyltransferase (sialic acid O-acetyltransferase NeuD family)